MAKKWKIVLIDVSDGFNITDALFAPDGTLLILERYYSGWFYQPH